MKKIDWRVSIVSMLCVTAIALVCLLKNIDGKVLYGALAYLGVGGGALALRNGIDISIRRGKGNPKER